jgi:hypothetical protein
MLKVGQLGRINTFSTAKRRIWELEAVNKL